MSSARIPAERLVERDHFGTRGAELSEGASEPPLGFIAIEHRQKLVLLHENAPPVPPQNAWTNSPLLSFGSNQVLFGGINSPASLTAKSCSMRVGCR
jgi:hypothetical protein